MDGAYPAELPPLVAVGGEGQVVAAIEEDSGGGCVGAAGADLIMGTEDVSGSVGGGHDERRDAAEAEEDERAVAVGEGGEGLVDERSELVKVADERKPRRRRRQVAMRRA